jgi:hypothetical protein
LASGRAITTANAKGFIDDCFTVPQAHGAFFTGCHTLAAFAALNITMPRLALSNDCKVLDLRHRAAVGTAGNRGLKLVV